MFSPNKNVKHLAHTLDLGVWMAALDGWLASLVWRLVGLGCCVARAPRRREWLCTPSFGGACAVQRLISVWGCAGGVSLGVAVWGLDVIGAGIMHEGGPGASGAFGTLWRCMALCGACVSHFLIPMS